MFFPDRVKSIKSTDRVLEVGPGGTPHPRSDVFLEKKYDDEHITLEQRGYTQPLSTDKEVVYFDGGRFPFSDNEFDYVICSHVLEHVDDIDHFTAELQRVAKRGYLEFPIIYYDYIYNFPEHVTLLMYKNGVIKYMPKNQAGINDFKAIQKLFYKSLEARYDDIVRDLKEYFFQGFEWETKIITEKTSSFDDLTFPSDRIVLQVNPRSIQSDHRLKTYIKTIVKNLLPRS